MDDEHYLEQRDVWVYQRDKEMLCESMIVENYQG